MTTKPLMTTTIIAALILPIIATLIIVNDSPAPYIDERYHTAIMRFEAERGWVFSRKGCVHVRWET
ncbi:MAG: hypothetical protein AAF125_09580, partial [Chloroflexota bacterium]